MKKRIVIIFLCLAAIAIAATVGYKLYQRAHGSRMQNEYPTDEVGYMEADIPHADSLIVGKWQNTANPHWYKVYYDDYDEDEQLFWGKEWNEAEDVLEEDMDYHGNGWFRWEKKGRMLREYATMSKRDVPIHRGYKIRLSSPDSLVYFEPDYKKVIYRFARVK